MVERAGEAAKLGFKGCATPAASSWPMTGTRSLQAWLGHRNIQHTVRYTELAPDRFKDFSR
jgi:hypothetical protein